VSLRYETRARFEAQILPHLDAAYRFARWLSRSPGDADDIVQDAALRAFRAFDSCRGSDPKAWLLTIVRNCHATAVMQRQRRAHVPLPDEHDLEDGHHMIDTAPDPERVAIRNDEQGSLSRLLAALSEEHREILVLREIEEMSYAQIAAVTDTALGTVMSRLARARAALREQWRLAAAGGARDM
jgi:RNA polymerase sigma-70 factor (ECF subfamily)